MNNVASLELCTELVALSGWRESRSMRAREWHRNGIGEWVIETAYNGVHQGQIQAYDLGFMLRQLPDWIDWNLAPNPGVGYFISGPVDENIPRADAEIPEDAVAKFCIALFKRGILTRQVK